MAKDKLTDYSATNASNTDVGGINIDEGMQPSAVNDAIREVMTHLKEFSDGTSGVDVLNLQDDDASASIKIQAPAAVTTTTTFTLPDGDGTSGQVLQTSGTGTLSWTSNGLANVVEDTTPQLGGNLDLNSQNITGTGGINITGTVTATDAVLNGTGAIKVPVGTTAQRPTPATGQLRFNSTDSSFEGYDGSAWGAIGGGAENSFTVFEYTATASQTTFSGADDNAATLSYTAGNIQVMLNGVVLDPSDYTATNGTSVVLASGAALNDVLNIYAFTSFSVADTVSASTGGTFSANVAVTGDLTVDTNTLHVDSSSNYVGISTSSPQNELDVRGTVEIGNGSTQRMYLQGTGNDFRFYDRANLAERMRIDSSGNLLVGKTANSIGGSGVVIRGGGELFSTRAGDVAGFNRLTTDGPIVQFYKDSSVVGVIGTQNWGIGTASPASNLHIYSTSYPALRFDDGTAYSSIYNDSTDGSLVYSADDGNARAGSKQLFYVDGTERLRIDSSGNVGIGTTSPSSSTTHIAFRRSTFDRTQLVIGHSDTSNRTLVNFFGNGSQAGAINVSPTTTTYGTSSDYRLKENVTADWDATTRLKQLNPVRFNFIADPDTTVDGFLAHEVQDIVPEAITGTKDAMRDEEYEVTPATGDIYTPATPAAFDEDGNEVTAAVDEVVHSSDVERPEALADGQQWRETTPAVMGTRSVPDYQGIDQSKLVPLLVKTIQELEARIAALENA